LSDPILKEKKMGRGMFACHLRAKVRSIEYEDSGLGLPGEKSRSCPKNNQLKKGWSLGSSGREPA
jgi:hypothetical protein